MLADSHCHLNYLDSPQDSLVSARNKGVKYILCPGVDIEIFSEVLKLAQDNKDVFAAVGLHPTEKESRKTSLNELLDLGQKPKVVGIGETGLDYYFHDIHDNNPAEINRQLKLFELHIQAAKELNKPLIIHTRDAEADTLRLLVEQKANLSGGVIHCFTGSKEFAENILNLGFYISFSGIITFRNAEILRDIAKTVPLDRILIETDSPYLAPVPVRGKSNEPAYLPYIAEFIANLRGMTYESFASQTTENFLRFCKI